MAKKIDMTGWVMKEHGVPDSRLTVIKEIPNYANEHNKKDKKVWWLCKCECGKEKIICGKLLRSGNTKSCGCLSKEILINNIKNEKMRKPERLDISNEKYGKLTPLYINYNKTKEKNRTYWTCKCDCGNVVDVELSCLRSGNTSSCGCLGSSVGEYYIEQLLKKENISFIKEYTNSALNKKRFDFAILKNNKIIRLVEFDGEQHFREYTNGYGRNEPLSLRKKRDIEKNKYAFINKIPLVRIPYWKRHNIVIEDIMGDKYLVHPPNN